ncbi:MAG: glutamate--tRNA ligase [Deltaproteobacteria bacterium]|jgi:glutamyl-tRNA synthetase|nr:glutamate--tRNA ligase [Deltaproteobacteria bacterium]
MITRFAPSPTGHLHIGGARTALFNYLLARKENGRFVLRIEDTDALRSTEEYTQSILKAMKWLGLSWDGEPIFQRARSQFHRDKVLWLVEKGLAYWCHCKPEEIEISRQKAMAEGGKPRYDGRCRELGLGPAPGAAVRFKGPDSGQIGWTDLVKGPIVFEATELDDLVLLRSDNMPTYNLAVVVDDIDMGITEVIRGDDHVNNTPRQILLYRAFGANPPNFGHLPMILGADKSRLSKRHGATSVMAYHDLGYLPEALVNYLARLGWSHGDREIFSLKEMEELFSLKNVGKSAAVFNPEKLDWLNAHYLKTREPQDLANLLKPFLEKRDLPLANPQILKKIVLTLRERSKTLEEMASKAEFYLLDLPKIDPDSAKKILNQQGLAILARWKELLKSPPQDHGAFENQLRSLAAELGVKAGVAAQPLRLALTGVTASPGLYEVMEILGPQAIQKRIEAALAYQVA